ncbi:DUF6718 family protein [Escherichia coli]
MVVYLVAKQFGIHGSFIYKVKTSEEANKLHDALVDLGIPGLEIVVLTDPDIYMEYSPYTYVDTDEELIKRVLNMKGI